jgi:hypothetical protein
MSDKQEKKMCPQCEGVGQEDVGSFPVKCRKCLGSGEVVSIKRVGLFSPSFEGLTKEAQSNGEEPTDEPPADDLREDSEQNETVGLGYDQMSILRSDMSMQELQSGIFSMLRGFSPDEMKLALKEVCEMNGNVESSVIAQCERGHTPEHGIMTYVYTAVDSMDNTQLRDFYRVLRSLATR